MIQDLVAYKSPFSVTCVHGSFEQSAVAALSIFIFSDHCFLSHTSFFCNSDLLFRFRLSETLPSPLSYVSCVEISNFWHSSHLSVQVMISESSL